MVQDQWNRRFKEKGAGLLPEAGARAWLSGCSLRPCMPRKGSKDSKHRRASQVRAMSITSGAPSNLHL